MNNNRECYEVIKAFPAKVKLTLKSTPPDIRMLNPVFRRLGSEDCLFRPQVQEVKGKEVTLLLPMPRCPLVEGRYEICIHDACCEPCDCIEVWLEADCEIEKFEVIEPEEKCNDC